ncbi:MAG: 3'-5' exonuclease [Flavobacteriales bacterium]|nr:3'-5' exonuclease [Flavobacteriales bacterium]
MDLKLTKPVCFFDLETTGLKVAEDRIVEISILKIFPNGTKESKTWLVNPEMKIPEETIAIHHITNEKVENEPTFNELAPLVYEMVKDCDLAGFNSNKFDVPLLAEEFLRAGIDLDLDNNVLIDIQNIFHKMEQRTLVAAYKFYCEKDLTNAHSAAADTEATYEILLAQLDRYPEDLKNDMGFLSEFSSRGKNVDFVGHIVYNDKNEEVINFGKHRGKLLVDVFDKEPGYYGWMMGAQFPLYTKKTLEKLFEKYKADKEAANKRSEQEKLSDLMSKFNKKI